MKQQFLASVAGTARIAAVGLLVCCGIPAVAQPHWDEPVQITKGIEVSTVQFLQNGMLLIAAGDSVHLINPDGTGLHTLFEQEGIRRANMGPDGQLVVLDDDLDIFVANRDGSGVRPIASGAKPAGARSSVAPRITNKKAAVMTTSHRKAAVSE